jgi:hypothetical protein
MIEYVHEVYGTARALIRNPDGSVRAATPDELKQINDRYEPVLERSFKVPPP